MTLGPWPEGPATAATGGGATEDVGGEGPGGRRDDGLGIVREETAVVGGGRAMEEGLSLVIRRAWRGEERPSVDGVWVMTSS